MDKEIERFLKIMQTSVHDQISALKEDVKKVADDSQAALEICAELERSVNINPSDKQLVKRLSDIVNNILKYSAKDAADNELEFSRLRMLFGINHLFSRLSTFSLTTLRLCSDDPKTLSSRIRLMLQIVGFWDDTFDKINSAEEEADLLPIGEECVKKYMALQSKIEKPPLKMLKGFKLK